MTEEVRRAIWRPMGEAPRDGTWILIRGRNSAGRFMTPIVGAWRSGLTENSRGDVGWFDAASGKKLNSLIADVPPGHAADWASLPDWESDV